MVPGVNNPVFAERWCRALTMAWPLRDSPGWVDGASADRPHSRLDVDFAPEGGHFGRLAPLREWKNHRRGEHVRMGRIRSTGEGTTYHLMARGNNRRRIFEDDLDRADLHRRLDAVVTRRSWICFGYCFLDNHLHLVATTPRPDVGDGMRDLLARYARYFNRRHGRTGHLFSERYRMVVIEDDAQLLATIRYVALNPTRAGLTASPAEWAWSSYGALAAGSRPVPALSSRAVLELFHPEPARARELLVKFVEDDGQRLPETDGTPPTPSVRSLVQTLGPRRALDAAADLGHSGAAIAAALEAGHSMNEDWLKGKHSIVKPRRHPTGSLPLLTPGTIDQGKVDC
jgi:REP element-mobilizing transposase RayT